jgi:hypothetical protein
MENKTAYSKKLAKHFEARKQDLTSIRSQVESTMDEITELVVPHRSYMNSDMNYAMLPNQDIYDQTGAQSVKYLTSMIDSGTANPGLNWFSLKPKRFLGGAPEIVNSYMSYVTSAIMEVFSDPETGFYSGNPVVISDMVAYGTACMMINYVPGEGFQYTPIHISEIYIAESAYGHVNTVLRKFKVSASQCVERFGLENVSSDIKKAHEEAPDKLYEIWHYASSNPEFISLKKNSYKNKPFRSCYFLEQSGEKEEKCLVLEEEHLSYFPYNVPRFFKRPNMPWGFGPAFVALPNLRSIQNMEMTFQAAIQKTVDPILLASDDGVIIPNSLEPGTIIQGGIDTTTNSKRIEPMPSPTMPQFLDKFLQGKKDEIKRLFYADSLMFHDGPQMTREEVITRKEEQMLSLGPDLKLYMEEHLIPAIIKTHALLIENKLLAPPPDELKELLAEGFKVEFNSPLLRYQRIGELQAAERILMAATQIAQFDQSVLTVVNPRGMLKLYQEILQAPPSIFNSEQQQKAMEQSAQMSRQQEMQMKVADMADKNKYMIQQSGGDPSTSSVAALAQMQEGQGGGFNGLES